MIKFFFALTLLVVTHTIQLPCFLEINLDEKDEIVREGFRELEHMWYCANNYFVGEPVDPEEWSIYRYCGEFGLSKANWKNYNFFAKHIQEQVEKIYRNRFRSFIIPPKVRCIENDMMKKQKISADNRKLYLERLRQFEEQLKLKEKQKEDLTEEEKKQIVGEYQNHDSDVVDETSDNSNEDGKHKSEENNICCDRVQKEDGSIIWRFKRDDKQLFDDSHIVSVSDAPQTIGGGLQMRELTEEDVKIINKYYPSDDHKCDPRG
jgi:hypothetical protein